jgi:hypothetical protein
MNTSIPNSTSEGFTMGRSGRWLLIGMSMAVFSLAGCADGQVAGIVSEDPPVQVEKNDASGLSRLTLSTKAADRLGIATAAVAEGSSGSRTVVPYSAIVYDKTGATWAYTNPEGLVYLRAAITVERIAEDLAILTSGPPVGTAVVTIGAAELWGVETGVGGGH